MITFWNLSILTVLHIDNGRYWLRIRGNIIANNVSISLLNVYAPHNVGEKIVLWNYLSEIINEFLEDLICLIGDFNYVRGQNERLKLHIYGNGFSWV